LTALSFDLEPSRAWSLELSLTRRACRDVSVRGKHIHSWAFTLLQGVTRDHPSTASLHTRPAPTGTVPLMGFGSLQRSRARRSRSTQRFQPLAPCVFRVRALLTPCSPSGLPGISDQAAPGITTFRALFLPEIRRSFELTRALLSVAQSERTHASSAVCSDPTLDEGDQSFARNRVSRLQGFHPSGNPHLCKSGFRALQRPMPSWFSSSPGPSPPCPPRNRRSSSAHALRSDRLPLRGTTQVAPQRLARLGGGVVSLETANPLEVLPLYPPVSSGVPAALGY